MVAEVTKQLKLRGWDLSATTQVKVLSPEMINFAQGQVFHDMEANSVAVVKGETAAACRGLSPWQVNQGLLTEPGRTDVFHGSRREADEVTIRYVTSVVGPMNNRGVDGVMPVEGTTHSKESAAYRKEEGKEDAIR